jgi:hypothetical protein
MITAVLTREPKRAVIIAPPLHAPPFFKPVRPFRHYIGFSLLPLFPGGQLMIGPKSNDNWRPRVATLKALTQSPVASGQPEKQSSSFRTRPQSYALRGFRNANRRVGSAQ